VSRPRDGLPQSRNCACSSAGISFKAIASAETIPHAHRSGEASADVEGGSLPSTARSYRSAIATTQRRSDIRLLWRPGQ
jgi:hypothetical protein